MIRREESPLHIKSYAFAITTVNNVKVLMTEWKLHDLYKQLLKSGTSIAANVREAEFAQSQADFVSKLSIALKESNETLYWLQLLKDTNSMSIAMYEDMYRDCNELISILVASVRTAKNRM